MIPQLRVLLFEWLPKQRWFDAAHADVADVTVIRTEVIGHAGRRTPTWPVVLWVPLEVMIDEAPVICQAVLALAPVVPPEVPLDAVVGEVSLTPAASDGDVVSGDDSVMVYEALASPPAAARFVTHVGGGSAPAEPERVDDSPWVTVVTLPQQRELTLYRRIQAGPHPDVELTTALATGRSDAVRPPAAVWRKNRHDLASLRRNVRRGADGRTLAAASVAELLQRRCAPERNPLDLADDLHRLGEAVASVHVASAERLGSSDGSGDELVRTLVSRLPHRLAPADAERVASAYRRLSHADDLGRFIRVHGNLDLTSVERTRQGWFLTRFGCNPDSALMFEHRPMSPLCDLAPLLRGLSSVAAAAVAAVAAPGANDGPNDGPSDAHGDAGDDAAGDAAGGGDLLAAQRSSAAAREVGVLAAAWEERCADALIAGYASVGAVQRLLPVERISRDALLTLFELELAVRAAVRSMGDDPNLVRIPLTDLSERAAAIADLRW